MKIEYPRDVKSLHEMLAAAQGEITRLSGTVEMLASQANSLEGEIKKWEQRFDRLLEIR